MRRHRYKRVSTLLTCGVIGSALGAGVAVGAVATGPSSGVHRALATERTHGARAAAPAAKVVHPAVLSDSAGAAGDGVAVPNGGLYTLHGSWPAIGGLAHAVVNWSPRPGGGAWEVSTDGGVFSRDGAPFYGSTGGVRLQRPIVGIASTPTGHGYWLVASDGGVFSFGDARFYGSTGNVHLAKPIVGMASTSSGHGYWLVASDGGVFSFGDARFHGSTGNIRLTRSIVGMSSSSDGGGYWLVASDGGLFSFGDAGFSGSVSGRDISGTASVSADGSGYDEVQHDGSVWTFAPGVSPSHQQISVPASASVAATAVSVAMSEVGKPYVYGAAGPNAFDCSGLAQYAYARAGVSLPRNSTQQMAVTQAVSAANLQPGDLVFFYPGATHVGIYVGNGAMVDAPHAGAAVRVESVEYFGPLVGASRPGA